MASVLRRRQGGVRGNDEGGRGGMERVVAGEGRQTYGVNRIGMTGCRKD